MATLEKIRSKSVLLIVIIGLALLAFIVGDALTNSQKLFGTGTTVASVGSDKIDYTEYQQKREELNNQLEQARRQNPEQYANFDTQILGQMAIDQLVSEHLLDAAVSKAGIKTSPEQLRFYILEAGMQNPDLNRILQQLNQNGINAATPQQAYEIIFNPKANGLNENQVAPYRHAWLAMEEATKKQIMRQTYQRLLIGTVHANNLDKQSLHKDYVNTTNIQLAYKPYGQLSEKEYPVSDADLKKAYDAEKGKFKVEEPTKDISFIAVAVAPSEADRKLASQLAQQTVKALSDSSSNMLDKNLKKNGLAIERKDVLLSSINGPIKDFVSTAAPNTVSLVSDNNRGFTVVRMGSRSMQQDSIQLNLIQVAGSTLPSKVLASLNGGLSIDSISTKFSPDSVMAQKEQWIPLFTADGPTNAIEKGQLDSLMQAGGKYIRLMTQPEGSLLAQVSKITPAKEVVEYEVVNYEVKPSTATVNAARTKLEKFLAANNTAAKFNENAAKAGYNVQNYSVSQSSPAISRMPGMNQYFPETRQVIRWVMIDGKPGEVSHIYEAKDALHPMLYAVAVDREYKDYIPVENNDVKTYLTQLVRNDKAGDKLLKQYKPKATSVQNAATAMGVPMRDNVQVRFGAGNVINDAAIMGKIAGSKPGKTVIMKGKDGIYVYQVTGKSTENFPYNDQQFEQNYFRMINPDMQQMLKGTKKVKNNAYKFEAGD